MLAENALLMAAILLQGFVDFSRSVSLFSSLPLILHNQGVIFEKLKEHIALKDELCLESFLDLCSAFALDLQVNLLSTTQLGKKIIYRRFSCRYRIGLL